MKAAREHKYTIAKQVIYRSKKHKVQKEKTHFGRKNIEE